MVHCLAAGDRKMMRGVMIALGHDSGESQSANSSHA